MNPLSESSTRYTGTGAVIGVFDSGVGGLSVLKHVREQLPAAAWLYFADSLHAPYGAQTPAYIIERSRSMTRFLLAQGAQAIVVACNTATAAAIRTLRQEFSVPIVGMEPAVKPAAAATRSGVVGVLATTGTLKSAQFAALLEHYGKNIQVVTQGCVGLVERIERGELDSAATRRLVRQYVAPLLEVGADTIVLGCTHYPFVKTLIAEVAGPGVVLIDTGAAVARQLQRRLLELSVVAGAEDIPVVSRCWSNSPATDASDLIRWLIGEDVRVEQAPEGV